MRPYIPQKIFSVGKYAFIILNSEIKLAKEIFGKIWDRALIRQTVDGGSNHFHKFYTSQIESGSNVNVKLPEITSGDFDSIDPKVMEFLKKNGQTKIVLTEDQNETDFTKGLMVLKDFIHSNKLQIETVIALVEPSGRIDHTLANLNTLHKHCLGDGVHLYLMCSESLTWLLPCNATSTIQFQPQFHKPCGIVPLSGPTNIVSQGLRWELNDDIYHLGGIVSTSNEIVKTPLQILPKVHPVVFTVEIKSDDYEF